MSLAMRLSRGGSKKRPYYRIVVADSRSPRDGKYIERIGSYNPLLAKDSDERVKIDVDRAKHWLSVGAQPSDRVLRFLDAAGIRERAARNNPNKGEPGEKAKERVEEKATKAADAEEAKKAAEEEAKAAAEAPKEEAAPAEEKPAEEAKPEEAKAEEAKSDEAKSDAAPAEEAQPEEAKADAPAAEEKPAEDNKAEDAKADDAEEKAEG